LTRLQVWLAFVGCVDEESVGAASLIDVALGEHSWEEKHSACVLLSTAKLGVSLKRAGVLFVVFDMCFLGLAGRLGLWGICL